MKAILAVLALLAGGAAQARPVVLELFTSEACSSCPPADELLADLQKSDPDLLALSFHVTYWNSPAWTDKYSLKEATDRQSWYAGLEHSDTVYTPEAVVDGGASMVGSSRGDVTAAIASARQAISDSVAISIGAGSMLTVKLGAGEGQPGTIWVFGFDSQHVSQIGGGENGGATLREVNVVRSAATLGTWLGVEESFTIAPPAGERIAVILQRADGKIMGAAAD